LYRCDQFSIKYAKLFKVCFVCREAQQRLDYQKQRVYVAGYSFCSQPFIEIGTRHGMDISANITFLTSLPAEFQLALNIR
jgi:hypothetical protein